MPGSNLSEIVYDREKAVAYARKFALKYNPKYYSFSGLGGDCSNFVSQCIFEGTGVMNYKPLYGWYYNSANDRTPAWTGVKYLYNFLVANKGTGPYAEETEVSKMLPGDVIQLATYLPDFHHTLIITETGDVAGADNILICSHSYDSLDRPLNSYEITKIRYLHIIGARK